MLHLSFVKLENKKGDEIYINLIEVNYIEWDFADECYKVYFKSGDYASVLDKVGVLENSFN